MVTVASAVWSGAIPLHTGWNCTEAAVFAEPGRPPQTMKQELARIGYLGAARASHAAQPIAAHFELHIEQGPVLERERRRIGVVTGAQACHWFEVAVRGRDSHAGTTPLAARKDALLAAAKMVVAANAAARALGGVATVGGLRALPGNINTIAHTAAFSLDVRHQHDAGAAAIVARCRAAFAAIAREDSDLGVDVAWTTLVESKAVHFDPACIRAVEAAAAAASACGAQGAMPIISGATHDSCHVSTRCPTAMIFTPTKDGLSHTPTEYCKPEDCVLGAQVLMGAVLLYDAGRFE